MEAEVQILFLAMARRRLWVSLHQAVTLLPPPPTHKFCVSQLMAKCVTHGDVLDASEGEP